jgi:hypothetical protein
MFPVLLSKDTPSILSSMATVSRLPSGMTLLDKIGVFASELSKSNLFLGMIMILINIGSRHVDFKFADSHKWFLTADWLKYLLIFAVVFSATRDISVAAIITLAFVVIVMHLFNNKSKYCILPKSFIEVDTNGDGELSPQEIKAAYLRLKAQGKVD